MSDASHRWPALMLARSASWPEQGASPEQEREAERQRVFDEAREQGYEAGKTAAEQSLQAQTLERLQQLDQLIANAGNQLGQWQTECSARFEDAVRRLLRTLAVEHMARDQGFYDGLLAEATAEFTAEQQGLQIQIASDLEAVLPASELLVIDDTLPTGELRVACGAQIACVAIDTLVSEALDNVVQQQDPSEHVAPD